MELLAKIFDEINIDKAYKQVVSNRGSKGVDGVTVDDLLVYIRSNWSRIKEEILTGRYFPQAVLRVEIPKTTGGVRLLGIPTVIDRLIQQAIQQVLAPIFDIDFSEFSYGFRKGRGVHHAVLRAQRYINQGGQDIIDLYLKSFFDIVTGFKQGS